MEENRGGQLTPVKGDKPPDLGGPWCVAAILCEEVDEPQRGGARSLRNMFTGIQVGHFATQWQAAVLFLSLTRADANDSHDIRVEGHTSYGSTQTLVSTRIEFEEGKFGLDWIFRTTIPIDQPGVVWFDIFINGELANRAVCRVVHTPGTGATTLYQP